MKDLLDYNELFDPIEPKNVKLVEKTNQAWNKLNKKTVSLIRQ